MLCCLTTMMRGVCVVLSHNDDLMVCVLCCLTTMTRVCVVFDGEGVCCVVSQR